MARKKKSKPEVVGLLGVGLDQQDGHKRVTHCDDIVLVGGSQETHENMQDIAVRLSESLRGRGKRLQDASPDEVIDLLNDATN